MDSGQLHPRIWKSLQARRTRLPHALLLSGHAGIGKFALARQFAGGLLCETPLADGHACGQCQACHWLARGNHPDLRIVVPEALQDELGVSPQDDGETTKESKSEKKPSQQITIEQIRELESFLTVGTHRQGLRIILLYPAEAMNRNTANSILKSLEEPSESTLFLLVSSNPSQLLPTIRSRCQQVAVPIPEKALAESCLQTAFGLKAGEAGRWLALAGGAPLLAGELAESSRQRWLFPLLEELGKGGHVAPLEAAANLEKLLKESSEPNALRHLIDWTQKWTHDLGLCIEGQTPLYFIAEAAVLGKLGSRLSGQSINRFYRSELLPRKREADHPLNLRLFLESFFARYRALFQTTGS